MVNSPSLVLFATSFKDFLFKDVINIFIKFMRWTKL